MFRSLRWSLLSTGLAGAIAMACLLTQALWGFGRLHASAEAAMNGKDVVADILPPPMYLIELRLALSEAVEGAVTPADTGRQVDRLVRDYETRFAYWQQRLPPALDDQLLRQQHASSQAFIAAARERVLAPLAAGDAAAARSGLAAADALYRAHRQAVDRTVTLASGWADQSMAEFADARRTGTVGMLAVTLLALAAVVAIYIAARRAILRPLASCADHARAVAAGDLTREVCVTREDELGLLQRAIGEMTRQLARMVGDVRGGIDAIASASAQIATGNQDLSSRTEQQAGRLQQTASSMALMAGSVRANAERAGDASRLAHGVADVVQQAGAAVGRVVGTMDGIRDASRRIADITGVIGDIAFQTNLLALNAAVEAARAGEQGRGFAVVAAEVRGLATRCAEASRQIQALVDSSRQRVESGHAMVGEAGRTMDAACAQVAAVTALIGEIAGASREQDGGVREVSDAVVQLDAATQQNAALVEQTAAAADSLRVQADRLAQAVTVFRLQPA